MSKWGESARQVQTQGAENRRSWDPDPKSAHYQLYLKWQSIASDFRTQDNFCHYWRVVLFWAPLAITEKRILEAYDKHWVRVTAMAIIMGGLAITIALLASPFVVIGTTVVFVFAAYILFGMLTVAEVAKRALNKSRGPWRWLAQQEWGILCLFTLLAAPIIIAIFVLAILGSPIGFIVWLQMKKKVGTKLAAKLVSFLFHTHPKKVFWLRPWLIFPAFLLAATPFSEMARFLVVVILLGSGAFAVIALVSWLVDTEREKLRTSRLERQRAGRIEFSKLVGEYVLRDVFAKTHPNPMQRVSHEKYYKWLRRYQCFCQKQKSLSSDEFWLLPFSWHYEQHRLPINFQLIRQRNNELNRQHQQPREEETVTKRESIFWKNVGDFFQLLWMLILTRKWRICPLMDVRRPTTSTNTE